MFRLRFQAQEAQGYKNGSSFGAKKSREFRLSVDANGRHTRLDLGLEHEDSLEAYYNLAITGWLLAAPPPSRSAASALSPPRSNSSPTERYI